jgi:hypothetical protein
VHAVVMCAARPCQIDAESGARPDDDGQAQIAGYVLPALWRAAAVSVRLPLGYNSEAGRDIVPHAPALVPVARIPG